MAPPKLTKKQEVELLKEFMETPSFVDPKPATQEKESRKKVMAPPRPRKPVRKSPIKRQRKLIVEEEEEEAVRSDAEDRLVFKRRKPSKESEIGASSGAGVSGDQGGDVNVGSASAATIGVDATTSVIQATTSAAATSTSTPPIQPTPTQPIPTPQPQVTQAQGTTSNTPFGVYKFIDIRDDSRAECRARGEIIKEMSIKTPYPFDPEFFKRFGVSEKLEKIKLCDIFACGLPNKMDCIYPDLVMQFYANMTDIGKTRVCFTTRIGYKMEVITINPKLLAQIYGVTHEMYEEFSTPLSKIDIDLEEYVKKIKRFPTSGKELMRSSCVPYVQLLQILIKDHLSSRVGGTSVVTEFMQRVSYCVYHEKKFNIWEIIVKMMMSLKIEVKNELLFPLIITRILKYYNVDLSRFKERTPIELRFGGLSHFHLLSHADEKFLQVKSGETKNWIEKLNVMIKLKKFTFLEGDKVDYAAVCATPADDLDSDDYYSKEAYPEVSETQRAILTETARPAKKQRASTSTSSEIPITQSLPQSTPFPLPSSLLTDMRALLTELIDQRISQFETAVFSRLDRQEEKIDRLDGRVDSLQRDMDIMIRRSSTEATPAARSTETETVITDIQQTEAVEAPGVDDRVRE